MKKTNLILLPLLLGMSIAVSADVVSVSETHYVLKHEASAKLSPGALWERMITPREWWHPDHTYSGSAANLSLSATAGGLWREDWDGGSVQHGRVVLVQEGKMLRMEAPFGPLQGAGAYVVWSLSIEAAEDGGSVITFHETAIAPAGAALDRLAPAVDAVKQQAIERLANASAGS